jgi:cation transport regulator ChaC
VSRLALFAYGSLVSRASAERTLGRPVEHACLARLAGWRRRWSAVRDNLAVEKTFARADTGAVPSHCVALNVERGGSAEGPNGALIEISEPELERLALRELRYRAVDVTESIAADEARGFGRVVTFTARPENYASTSPSGAVILAPYVRAVEGAFASVGPEQLDLFRATTGEPPVEVIEAVLLRDEIPPGNPREW